MKNIYIIPIILLMLFSCNNKKQSSIEDKKYKNTKIYLSAICEKVDSTNLLECIQFSDNRQQAVSIAGEQHNYISIVNPDKNVIWKQKKNSKLKIKILEVNYKSNDRSVDILTKKNLKGKKGIVTGKVKQKGQVTNLANEFYNITFEIEGVVYTIDPVIQYHD